MPSGEEGLSFYFRVNGSSSMFECACMHTLRHYITKLGSVVIYTPISVIISTSHTSSQSSNCSGGMAHGPGGEGVGILPEPYVITPQLLEMQT